MSNVLIGIIGVILFIGLALAGALILGEDFKTTSSSSKAAQTMSQLQQGAHAISMYQLKSGQQYKINDRLIVLMPRFLKSIPVLPTGYSEARVYTNRGDTIGTTGDPPVMVATMMPLSEEDTCKAIQEQTNGTQNYVTALNSDDIPKSPAAGCFRSAGIGSYHLNNTSYVAYVRF